MRGVLFAWVILLLVSCKDKAEEEPKLENFIFSGGYYICNEGNFTYSNASLSYVDPESGRVENQVFVRTNGFPLGDVVQSAAIINNILFIVVNNSGKVVLCDPNTVKVIKTIEGLVSPRYVEQISDSLVLISDLYDTRLHVVNLNTFQLRALEIGAGSEEMIRYQDFLYTNTWSGGNKIHKISTQTLTKEGEIVVTAGPLSMARVGHNLWVISQGDEDENPALTRINLLDFTIDYTYSLQGSASPSNLSVDSLNKKLYFLAGGHPVKEGDKGGLFSFDYEELCLDSTAIVPRANSLFYHHYYDGVSKEHFLCDAKDYLQDGTLLRYNEEGLLLDSYKLSVIPSFILKF